MKRDGSRTQGDTLLAEGFFKRPQPMEHLRKRRKRREEFADRLYKYLRELDR
jgi:hypothetical protein